MLRGKAMGRLCRSDLPLVELRVSVRLSMFGMFGRGGLFGFDNKFSVLPEIRFIEIGSMGSLNCALVSLCNRRCELNFESFCGVFGVELRKRSRIDCTESDVKCSCAWWFSVGGFGAADFLFRRTGSFGLLCGGGLESDNELLEWLRLVSESVLLPANWFSIKI